MRLPVCNWDSTTTVHAHYRSVSLGAGMAEKPSDWLGAHACSACHDIIDSRDFLDGWSRERVRLAHAEGVFRTLARLAAAGLVKI